MGILSLMHICAERKTNTMEILTRKRQIRKVDSCLDHQTRKGKHFTCILCGWEMGHMAPHLKSRYWEYCPTCGMLHRPLHDQCECQQEIKKPSEQFGKIKTYKGED